MRRVSVLSKPILRSLTRAPLVTSLRFAPLAFRTRTFCDASADSETPSIASKNVISPERKKQLDELAAQMKIDLREERERLKKHGPPVTVRSANGALATELYIEADEKGIHDQIEKELNQIFEAIDGNPMILSPVAPRSGLVEEIDNLKKQLKLSKPTCDLLEHLVEKKRFSQFVKIQKIYDNFLTLRRKQVPVTITVPNRASLTERQKSDIFEALRDQVPHGHTALVTYKEDPSIMGGFIISAGNNNQDYTTQTALVDAAVAALEKDKETFGSLDWIQKQKTKLGL